jgi:hypothetical protein
MMKHSIPITAASILFVASGATLAEERTGCFAGQDQQGASARMALRSERYGEYFEISGNVSSPNIGVVSIKADGWSGAGRMFVNHEYESGALYIRITEYSEAGFVLVVDGYGRFPFHPVAC